MNLNEEILYETLAVTLLRTWSRVQVKNFLALVKKVCLQAKQAGWCNGIIIYLTSLGSSAYEVCHQGDAKNPQL